MNDEQLNNLFAAARRAQPDTARVERGFETRLLARLRAERAAAVPWFVWTWRLAPLFAVIVIALGIWNYASSGNPLAELTTDYSGEAALVVMLTGD